MYQDSTLPHEQAIGDSDSFFVTDSSENMSQKAQSLPIHSYFCADSRDFTILSESDIFYRTGTNGISLDNLLTFKGW